MIMLSILSFRVVLVALVVSGSILLVLELKTANDHRDWTQQIVDSELDRVLNEYEEGMYEDDVVDRETPLTPTPPGSEPDVPMSLLPADTDSSTYDNVQPLIPPPDAELEVAGLVSGETGQSAVQTAASREPKTVYSSCKDVPASLPSGYYTIRPTEYTGNPFQGYCDMQTDGGGWLLVSTQDPSNDRLSTANPAFIFPQELDRKGTLRGVSIEKLGSNQKYSDELMRKFAWLSKHGYEVMAEEQSGPDRAAGLVMVYALPPQSHLLFTGSAGPIVPAGRSIMWRTPSDWFEVFSNVDENAWGVSVHGNEWNHVHSFQRCLKKSNFSEPITGATNGDYKMQFRGNVGGTTRCSHTQTGIGLSHWIRPLSAPAKPKDNPRRVKGTVELPDENCAFQRQNFDSISYRQRSPAAVKARLNQTEHADDVFVFVVTGQSMWARTAAVFHSWFKHVPNGLFVTDSLGTTRYEGWPEVVAVNTLGGKVKSQEKWHQAINMFATMCLSLEQYKWIVFCDDDSFFNVYNFIDHVRTLGLMSSAATEKHVLAQVLQYPACNLKYPSGGACFAMSKATVSAMLPIMEQCWSDARSRCHGPASPSDLWSDVILGYCFREVGAVLHDLPFQSQPPWFYHTDLGREQRTPSQLERPVSFHYIDPNQQSLLERRLIDGIEDESTSDYDKKWADVGFKYATAT